MHIEKLIKKCKSNKDTKWYIKAFQILINYYFNLKNNSNNINSEHINIIGQALNCIITDSNRIPTDNDIHKMQHNMNNSYSRVQSIAGGYINNNHKIINDIIQYWLRHSDNNRQHHHHNTYDTDILDVSKFCAKRKNQDWYNEGWNLLVSIHSKIHNNLLSKNEGYSAIGKLLNCLVNFTNIDPIFDKNTLNLLHDRIKNRNSSFYIMSRLDVKYHDLNDLYKDWYFVYGKKGDPNGIYRP